LPSGSGKFNGTSDAANAGLTYVDMRNMIIAYLTFAEGIVSLFSAVPAS
jgi:hypothetical protein